MSVYPLPGMYEINKAVKYHENMTIKECHKKLKAAQKRGTVRQSGIFTQIETTSSHAVDFAAYMIICGGDVHEISESWIERRGKPERRTFIEGFVPESADCFITLLVECDNSDYVYNRPKSAFSK